MFRIPTRFTQFLHVKPALLAIGLIVLSANQLAIADMPMRASLPGSMSSRHASDSTPQSAESAAWITALQSIPAQADLPARYRPPPLGGRTFREIVRPTAEGDQVRLHISNREGRAPLDVLDLRIAPANGQSANLLDKGVRVTFDGRDHAVLSPGQSLVSDPVHLSIKRDAPYAISIYVGAGQRLEAWHRVARQASFVSAPGDHAADASSKAYRTIMTQFAWVDGLWLTPSTPALMAIGDSITDGMASSFGRHHRWPDYLARRAREAGVDMAVLNAGISGNRLLSDSPCYGTSLLKRFEAQLDAAPGVGTVIVLEGINDINFAAMPPHAGLDCDTPHTQVSASSLIAGYRALIEKAHKHGMRLWLATLTPADLPANREAIRLAVNQWIRNSQAADGVIDFDAALRDPKDPRRLLHAFDSGDHIHPSDAGYAAMAKTIPMKVLEARTR